MTPYVLYSDMVARIPVAHLVQALDDNNDGAADPGVWDAVAAAVAKEIDGILGVRFNVPFVNPIPAPVFTAAEVLAAELLYNRRGFEGEDKNPWAAQAKAQRAKLTAIAEGTQPLGPTNNRVNPSASIVAEKSKTASATGRTAV